MERQYQSGNRSSSAAGRWFDPGIWSPARKSQHRGSLSGGDVMAVAGLVLAEALPPPDWENREPPPPHCVRNPSALLMFLRWRERHAGQTFDEEGFLRCVEDKWAQHARETKDLPGWLRRQAGRYGLQLYRVRSRIWFDIRERGRVRLHSPYQPLRLLGRNGQWGAVLAVVPA